MNEQQISTAALATWARRPNDVVFNDIDDLVKHTEAVKDRSFIREAAVEHLSVRSAGDSLKPGADPLVLTRPLTPAEIIEPTKQVPDAVLNNLSFNQFCGLVGARAGEYRKLPATIAQIPLAYLAERAARQDAKILLEKDPKQEGRILCRALNSPSYGRIWNHELAKAVQDYIDPDTWTVPKDTAFHLKTGFITTNDRKAFIFMVDEKHPIELPGTGKPLFRGFYAWNSEVGDGAAGIAEFLFFSVCANRAIFGMSEFKELYIRHTSGAPDRWLRDAAPKLKEYVNTSPKGVVQKLEAAREKKAAKDEKGALEWLRAKGFTQSAAKETVSLARDSEVSGADPKSSPFSFYNLMMGATARARSVANNDEKVDLERQAGKLVANI